MTNKLKNLIIHMISIYLVFCIISAFNDQGIDLDYIIERKKKVVE